MARPIGVSLPFFLTSKMLFELVNILPIETRVSFALQITIGHGDIVTLMSRRRFIKPFLKPKHMKRSILYET